MTCIVTVVTLAAVAIVGSCFADDYDAGLPIAALVLARGGSKGIPLKNIVEIGPNQTLLGRTLDTIQKSDVFASVWVSTDHEQIAAEATRHGATVFARSATHAQDHSTSLEATREFLEAHPEIENFALVQCTSPFLRPHYLVEAVSRILLNVEFQIDYKPPCAFSVVRSYKLRWRMNPSSLRLEAINFDPTARPRRQDWPGELVETGMFYFTNRQLIMEMNSFQSDRCAIVEVEELDALEIDDTKDLALARLLVELE